MAVDAGYIASQQKRYTDALKSNDTGLVGRLEADAKRVGYTLIKPKPTPAPAPKPTPVSTATKSASVLGSIGKSAVSAAVDNAVAKAKLEPMVQAANNQTVAQPKPATTTTPTLDTFVSASQNTQAKPAFDMFTKPVAPVTTSAPVTTPVATTPFYNPTPVSTQTTLEKQAGILPTPTPTIEAYKAVAPTPTPTYTPSVLSQPQTQLEKEAGIVSMTPLASGKQLTQGALSGITQGIQEATGQPSGLQEAFNKATTTTPEVKAETQAPVVVPEIKAEAVTPAVTAPTKAEIRSQLAKQPVTFENYKAYLDSMSTGEELTPIETLYLENMRNEIYKDKGMLEKEMARTQDVIMERERQGLGIDSQQAYFTKLLSEMKKFEEPTVRATALPEGVPTLTTEGAKLAATVPTAIADVIKQETGQEAPQLTKQAEEMKKTPLDNFLANPNAETWDAFNKSGIGLENLTPEQRKIVEDYRTKTQTDQQAYQQEVKRIEDKIIDNTAKGLDTSSQERYLANLRAAFEENMRQQKEYDAYGKQLVGGILEGITSGAELGTGTQLTPETSQLMQYGQKNQLSMPTFQPTTQQQTPSFEDMRSAFRATASEQVDKQLAQENKALDLQIKQAMESRDFGVAEQLRAYKNAINQVNDQSFLSGLQQMQQYANRGLLGSGLSEDAMTRLGISRNQQLTQVAQDQQAKIAQLGMDYQQTLDRINLAKDKLRSGRAQNVDELTRQLISDQQDADKYKAEILKTEADRKKAEAQQIFDYVNLLAKESGYDMTPFVPFALAGDAKGLVQAMQQTGNLQLSTAGRELESRIRENEAQAKSAASGQIADKARASQIWSDINGYISDENGKPILKNGKVQPTYGAQMEAQKIAIDRQKATQAGAKKEETTNKPLSSTEISRQLDIAEKAIAPRLDAEFTEDDLLPTKTGKKILKTSEHGRFKNIMNSLKSQLNIDPTIIRIIYEQYGVPYTVTPFFTPEGSPSNPTGSLTNEVGEYMKMPNWFK